ncbi:aminotransferase class IV [Akkermansia sp.]|uniref:aminotransferase class IV n=1 Tax=Akkermansia sp. TaxID=1872421 RepID=UPI0025C40C04|nr:aminotransferase class IV [Akkermansia sp.]MCC8148736.1 aminotransferase class IV [Akkermansia sp.]
MCRLIFETIKWKDGRPELLPWHQWRMEAAMNRYGEEGGTVPDLASVLTACPGPEGRGIYKCHITYDTRGRVRRPSFEPYRPRPVKRLACVEIPRLDYSCKWEDRKELQAAGKGLGADEEALILQHGLVTDTRYSNVVFGDGSSWVTPETFLLPGTKRAFLLAEGAIAERPLKAEDIKQFRFCSLINAMLDPGDVVVRTEDILL